MEVFIFERPRNINLPMQGLIVGIQDIVNCTRMEHGKKRVATDEGEATDVYPPSKRSAHMLVSHSKVRRFTSLEFLGHNVISIKSTLSWKMEMSLYCAKIVMIF